MEAKIENFTEKELACRCGCGLQNTSDSTLIKLQALRYKVGEPLTITSGSRCWYYNKEVSKLVDDSPHLATEEKESYAIDISCEHSALRFKILKAAIEVGFTRIGIAQEFIHLDDDEEKPQEIAFLY